MALLGLGPSVGASVGEAGVFPEVSVENWKSDSKLLTASLP
jgi:hypothetical protein